MIERTIVDTATDLRRRREPYLVATVVSARGSVYRRPGARMLLTQYRWMAGAVSGGCLEADIARRGWWHTRDGAAVLLTYDSRIPEAADDDEVRAAFGLGCDGIVEVLLERAGVVGRIDPLALAERCIRGGIRGVVATLFRTTDPERPIGSRIAWCGDEQPAGDLHGPLRDAVIADARHALETGESITRDYDGDEVFIEVMMPPPHVFVFGTGHDAVPLARFAKALGWDVTLCGRQARVAVRDRFAGHDIVFGTAQELAPQLDGYDNAIAVVMNHDFDADRATLGMLLDSKVRYIGILGPQTRTARMLDSYGMRLHDDPRLHAPIGLELGAETPDEVALAIVAEIQAMLRRAPATNLRDHIGPIHTRPVAAVSS